MTTRTGVLSDEHVRMHCAQYNEPIPLGKSDAILRHELHTNDNRPPPRPSSIRLMANSIARIGNNPKIVTVMEKQFNEELKTASNPPRVYYTPGPTPHGQSLLSRATVRATRSIGTTTSGNGGNGGNGYSTPSTNGGNGNSTDSTNGGSSSDDSGTVQIRPQNLRRSEAFQRPGKNRKNATEPRQEYQTRNIMTPDDLNRFAQRALRSTDPRNVLRGLRHLSQPGTSASHAGSGQNRISLAEFRQMRQTLSEGVAKGIISKEDADDVLRVYIEKLKVDGDDNLQS